VRDEPLRRISELLGGRSVRWAQDVIGDYDGRDRTLEVFDARAETARRYTGGGTRSVID
jgi:hypothetical protein